MHTVLHITPHLGGGVGKVLLNYLGKVSTAPVFSHRVLSLEYANENALRASRQAGFYLADKMSDNHPGIAAEISKADIVLVHWWNHPLLYDLLVRKTLPPSRIVFWSHISGFHAPYVFSKPALSYPDLFVFTSPLSLETREVGMLPEIRRKALRTIWSTGGIAHAVSLTHKPHQGFKVGYIGTVDYGKLHPEFLKMCGMIDIPQVQFIVCGGPSEKQLRKEAALQGLGGKCLFTGHVEDVAEYIPEFDVFGYPLAPYHYGTCEQSLCESMAAGIPPVVLANRTESYIVEDGVTGIVAKDGTAYARGIEKLFKKPELRLKMSENARESARRRFSLERMQRDWDAVFNEALSFPKTARQWTGRYKGEHVSPHQLFLESLGKHGDCFALSMNARTESEKAVAEAEIQKLLGSSHLWRAATRGTPRHYFRFFPYDAYLSLWSSYSKEDVMADSERQVQ